MMGRHGIFSDATNFKRGIFNLQQSNFWFEDPKHECRF